MSSRTLDINLCTLCAPVALREPVEVLLWRALKTCPYYADLCMHRAGKGGNPELIRESQRRRYADPELVDKVITLDNAWRDGVFPGFM